MFYETANGNFPRFLSLVKKTISWRKNYRILSEQELKMWSSMVFWHGVDKKHQLCLIVRLGLACMSVPLSDRPRFSQAVGMLFNFYDFVSSCCQFLQNKLDVKTCFFLPLSVWRNITLSCFLFLLLFFLFPLIPFFFGCHCFAVCMQFTALIILVKCKPILGLSFQIASFLFSFARGV